MLTESTRTGSARGGTNCTPWGHLPGTFTGDSIQDLALLKLIWGDVYQVAWYPEGGYWRAGRRDRAEAVVTADNAEELNAEMRRDYLARIAPRFPAGDAA
jgi:hypothetical protein